MSVFYHDPQLKYLLLVASTTILMGGFSSTNLLTLARHLGVRRLFAIDGSTALVGMIVTISWAYLHPSVWAILGGQFVSTLYRVVISFVPSIAPGIRNSFRWDRECVHAIVHFGKWLLIGTAFTFFATQADRLILGRLISLSLLGIYGLAYQLSDVPRAIIQALGNRVAYPFIAKIIHQPMDQFKPKLLRYRFFALSAGVVLLGIMVSWGGLLVVHLYDHRYRQAAWMIPILALGLWQTLLYQTAAPVLFSLGKAKYNAIGNAAYCCAIFTVLPVAFHFFGMFGAVISVAAGDLPLYVAIQFGLMRQGVNLWLQDLKMTGIFVTTVLALHYLKFVF
jgi:O-antigen/teichoic acid export membrane protein